MLVLSVVGGAFATLAYALVALIVHRSTFRFRGWLKYAAFLPRAVPGMIAGLGVFYAMLLVPGLSVLNGTVWIIGLAYLSRYLSTGFGVMAPALAQIGPDLDRAARVMGATWWQTMTGIVLQLLRPAMLGALPTSIRLWAAWAVVRLPPTRALPAICVLRISCSCVRRPEFRPASNSKR